MNEDRKRTETIDTRGLRNPRLFSTLNKANRKMKKGNIIDVIVTDPGITTYVPAWVKRSNAEIIKVNEDEACIAFQIKV